MGQLDDERPGDRKVKVNEINAKEEATMTNVSREETIEPPSGMKRD